MFAYLLGVSLRAFLIGGQRLFETGINLAQLPEDQNEQNCYYEQQELGGHFLLIFRQAQIGNAWVGQAYDRNRNEPASRSDRKHHTARRWFRNNSIPFVRNS
jgi:hypothetical protein